MSKDITITTQLTKKIVLDCLMQIKIDHSITISENDLAAKVNLVFKDCKNMTAESFIKSCELLRMAKLYNKLPTSSEILNPHEKTNTFDKSKWDQYV